jgi:hypothetical protein
MSFDNRNITAISRSSSESDYSNLSRKLIDIICEEKYEGEFTNSKSRALKDQNRKGVKWQQESVLEPASVQNAN